MHKTLRQLAKKTYRATQFFTGFLHAPFRVGSICSSSSTLTSTLIQQIPTNTDGLIIDLGAGSGAVSNQLINAGVDPKNILAIEISPHLAKVFKKRCPTVPLSIGDARELDAIVQEYAPGQAITLIISSLPFRSMPKTLVKQITVSLQKVMEQHHCPLVQYSYAVWMQYPLKKYGFSPCASKIVVRNFPPARVEWYNF